MTFSSKAYLDKKTGPFGLGRFPYLQALVTEFQDTHKQGYKATLELENYTLSAKDVATRDYPSLRVGSGKYKTTGMQDHKLQVLANLANFAYDPINYEDFRKLNILDLFLDVLAGETEEEMVEFAMGGLCNCCLDKLNKSYIVENGGVELTIKCLSSSCEETVLSAVTTLMFLTTPDTKKETTADNVVELMKQFAESSSPRLSNLATIFLEDYCDLTADSGFTASAPKKHKI